jgi:hypothetical protein
VRDVLLVFLERKTQELHLISRESCGRDAGAWLLHSAYPSRQQWEYAKIGLRMAGWMLKTYLNSIDWLRIHRSGAENLRVTRKSAIAKITLNELVLVFWFWLLPKHDSIGGSLSVVKEKPLHL